MLPTLDMATLALVAGGKKATYGNMCVRGAVDGALAGATGGAGMLPFAAMSGPIAPATAGMLVGGGAAVGGTLGCVSGMWDLYKARNPLEQ